MSPWGKQAGARNAYHHGNLRDALVEAALGMITERGLAGLAIAELARAVGVSPAAPYRHFRDRNALVAEIARRGFEQLATELDEAAGSNTEPVRSLERCAQAHLAFAARDPASYAAMFEAGFPVRDFPDLARARNAALLVLRRVADAACERSRTTGRPPAAMVALHVWSLTHGIAALFTGPAANTGGLPMPPAELLEAGLLVYLQSLRLKP